MGSGAAKGTSVKGLGTTAWGSGAASVRPGARAGRSWSSMQSPAPTLGAPGRTSGAEPSARAQSHGPGALLLSPPGSLRPGEWGGLGLSLGHPKGPGGAAGKATRSPFHSGRQARVAEDRADSVPGRLLLLPLLSGQVVSNSVRRHPTGFSVPGILQARTLEWVAISFSNA